MQWQGNKPTEQKTIDNLKEYENIIDLKENILKGLDVLTFW